ARLSHHCRVASLDRAFILAQGRSSAKSQRSALALNSASSGMIGSAWTSALAVAGHGTTKGATTLPFGVVSHPIRNRSAPSIISTTNFCQTFSLSIRPLLCSTLSHRRDQVVPQTNRLGCVRQLHAGVSQRLVLLLDLVV